MIRSNLSDGRGGQPFPRTRGTRKDSLSSVSAPLIEEAASGEGVADRRNGEQAARYQAHQPERRYVRIAGHTPEIHVAHPVPRTKDIEQVGDVALEADEVQADTNAAAGRRVHEFIALPVDAPRGVRRRRLPGSVGAIDVACAHE